ncbi:hypothetical protein yberc0001_36570 [Yersinia bercovieri ATCC 43970]|uniref:Uncharacterized protein n=1 Tax=Yersinia bercovieri ATCC 43970 TaxID=349968 RepID=A0ABM9XUF8_YERBE|nr:hypothetical protein yberc0001_36570 [Yersinia bercovieri ATCC 43970]
MHCSYSGSGLVILKTFYFTLTIFCFYGVKKTTISVYLIEIYVVITV